MVEGGAVGSLRALAYRFAGAVHAVIKLLGNRADPLGNAGKSH
jgi:hypothetical protein